MPLYSNAPPPFPPDRFPHAPPPLPFMDASNVDGLLLLTQVYTSTKGLKATTDDTRCLCEFWFPGENRHRSLHLFSTHSL